MATILDEIIKRIREDLIVRKEEIPLEEIIDEAKATGECRNFVEALRGGEGRGPRVISELKKASPSKGIIREEFDVFGLAAELEENGAAALSVLTEKNYFKGSPDYLQAVTKQVNIPVLRKDFIVDPYQIYEAKAWGADAILLIAAALEAEEYKTLYKLAKSIGLYVLTEVHNLDELEMVLEEGAEVIGVNSRDLKTFETDLVMMKAMIQDIPDTYIKVAESGIKDADDIKTFMSVGASAFLIGETLMREPSPGKKLAELIIDSK